MLTYPTQTGNLVLVSGTARHRPEEKIMAHTVATFTAAEFDRELRTARAHLGADAFETATARALVEVGAVQSTNLEVVFGVAARIIADNGPTPSSIRRNYSLAGITRDYIDAMVAEANA